MSIRIMSAVFDAAGLGPTQKLVMLALADHANEAGRHVYPSVDLLTRKTGLSERTVRATIKELRSPECGILVLVHHAGAHYANEYMISLDKLASYSQAPEVQEPHPESEQPAPVAPQGCESCTPEVREMHPRGARAAPKPSYNHHVIAIEPEEAAKNFETTPGRRVFEDVMQRISGSRELLQRYGVGIVVGGIRDGTLTVRCRDADQAAVLAARLLPYARRVLPALNTSVKRIEFTAPEAAPA